MSNSARFATDEMKELCKQRAAEVAAGNPGPTGALEELRAYIPQPLPCEAWALYNKDGYMFAASSADGMNGWYFHVDCAEMPHYSMQGYEAQDNLGNVQDFSSGEAAIMASFIQGTIPYFFINGERFTEGSDRAPDSNHSYFVMCTGSNGRGALVHLDTAGTGASIFIYSSTTPVGTDERMGLDRILPEFEANPVDARSLPGILAGYANETYAPFWAVASE